MSTGISWPVIGGNPYEIPSSGEVSWSDLSDFLIALASAQNTTAQKVAARVATTTPINVGSASDYLVVVNLAVAGASSVILPAGVSGQVFVVADGKGDAATNNITVTTTGGATIAGAASFVVNVNGAAVGFCFSGSGNWTIVSLAAGEGGGSGIARSSIAAGTPNYVVFNAAGTGRLAEEQYLAASRGGLGTNVSAFSGYVKAMAGVFTAGGIDAADLPSGIDPTKLSPGTVSATEFAYLDDVTAPIQAALDSKAIGVASAQSASGITASTPPRMAGFLGQFGNASIFTSASASGVVLTADIALFAQTMFQNGAEPDSLWLDNSSSELLSLT